jgi:hypothetical protein
MEPNFSPWNRWTLIFGRGAPDFVRGQIFKIPDSRLAHVKIPYSRLNLKALALRHYS